MAEMKESTLKEVMEMLPTEETQLKKYLQELENHPLTAKMRAELAQAEMEKRKKAAEKIAELQKKQNELLPKLQADVESNEETARKCKAALETAISELQAAKYELGSQAHVFETEISKQKEILITTADPAIDAGIKFFEAKLEWLRTPGRISHQAAGATSNIFTMKKTIKQESNAAAVNEALRYCKAAIKELEKTKLSPTLNMQRIEAIKKGVPDINVYTEYQGEKPIPGPNTDPFAGLPTDSELEYRKEKLNEKFKKILKK